MLQVALIASMETAFIRSEFWRKLALLCAVVLMLLPGTVFAIPLQQTEQVTLNLQNQTAKTIGYVFISPNTNTKWRQNLFEDMTIEEIIKESKKFAVDFRKIQGVL